MLNDLRKSNTFCTVMIFGKRLHINTLSKLSFRGIQKELHVRLVSHIHHEGRFADKEGPTNTFVVHFRKVGNWEKIWKMDKLLEITVTLRSLVPRYCYLVSKCVVWRRTHESGLSCSS